MNTIKIGDAFEAKAKKLIRKILAINEFIKNQNTN